MIEAFAENKDNLEEFCKFYGELILRSPTLCLTQCYNPFREKASKFIDANSLMEMDKYILKNYALKEPERLLTSFKGNFKRPKASFVGSLYLTQYRFLATGQETEQSTSTVSGRPHGLIGALVATARDAKKRAIRTALAKGMADKFTEDILDIFQYNYPILNAYDIKKGKKKISYTVKLEYEHKGRQKEKILYMYVTPKKEKGESSQSFSIRLQKILDIIEETLLKAQTT